MDQLVPQFTVSTTVDCVAGMIQNLKIFGPAKYVNKKTVTRFRFDSNLESRSGVRLDGWVGGWLSEFWEMEGKENGTLTRFSMFR